MITRKMTLMQKVICNIKKAFQLRNVLADENNAGAVAGAQVTDPAPQVGAGTQQVSNQTQQTYQAQVQQPVVPMINYEQLIAQARQEEKNKLYPELNALKTQVNDLTVKLNDAMVQIGTKEATIQALNKELESLKNGQADPEVVKTMQATIDTLTKEVEGYKTEAQQTKLTAFKDAEIAKYEGAVIPELITGTTEEEITESVKNSNAKYLEIAQRIGVGVQAGTGATGTGATGTGATQQHLGGVLTQMGASVTPANPAVAGVAFNNQVVTDEMIRGMSREQYAEWRRQAGIR